MSTRTALLLLLAAGSLFATVLPAAAENRLEGTFHADSALASDGAEEYLLEQARWMFSGMIYGWRFRYVPRNPARGYEEQFELEPVHELEWGDPGLRIRQTWQEDTRILARIEYRMNSDQQSRRASWGAGTTVLIQGRGEIRCGAIDRESADEFDDEPSAPRSGEALEATHEALRMAVREHLRARHATPPRLVTGSIVLDRVPRIGLISGFCVADVRARMTLSDVRRYEVY